MTFHPQTNGQLEKTIQTLEDMLCGCTMEFEGSWDKYLPLMEFTYNNSYYTSIKMAHFKALYGKKCCMPIGWFEPREVSWTRLGRGCYVEGKTHKREITNCTRL